MEMADTHLRGIIRSCIFSPKTKKKVLIYLQHFLLVGVARFELAAS